MFARYDSLASECGLGLSEYLLSLLSRFLLLLELILESIDLLADCGSGANAAATDTASSIDGPRAHRGGHLAGNLIVAVGFSMLDISLHHLRFLDLEMRCTRVMLIHLVLAAIDRLASLLRSQIYSTRKVSDAKKLNIVTNSALVCV